MLIPTLRPILAMATALGVGAPHATGQKLYWSTGNIHRAELDGSNAEVVLAKVIRSPDSIALDLGARKMYWTDSFWVARSNLDGTDLEFLVTQGLRGAAGIALDIDGGKVYWTDDSKHKIQRANLDGTNVEDRVTAVFHPNRIALDLPAGKM